MTDHLFTRLIPEWGEKKIENLKLLHAIGSKERAERIERILNISSRKLLRDSLLNNNTLLPPSPKKDCAGEYHLGTVCYGRNPDGSDRELYPAAISENDLVNHLLLSGLSGVGKTSAAMNLLIQLASKGKRCIVLDNASRQWRNLISLDPEKYPFVKKIKIFTLGRSDVLPLYWNLFFAPLPKGLSFANWLGIVTGSPLSKSLFSGQGVADFIETEAEKLMAAYQDGRISLLPNLEDLYEQIKKQFAVARQMLWKQSTQRVLNSLIREHACDLFSSREPVNLVEEVLEWDGVVILEMDIEMPESLRILFQEAFLYILLIHNFKLGESNNEALRTAIFMEEFSELLPQTSHEKDARNILKTLFKTGRKFGLSLITINQEMSDCGQVNFVQANSKVQIHMAAQTEKDIRAVASGLFLDKDQVKYIDYIWRGQAILRVKGRINNCLIKFPLPPPIKRVSDEELIAWSRQS